MTAYARPSLLETGLSWLRYSPGARTPHRTLPDGRAIAALAAELGRPVVVAVVRNDGIGDWLLSLPLLRALERHDDVGEVVLVTPGHYHALLDPSDRYSHVAFGTRTIIAPGRPGGVLGKVLAVAAATGLAAAREGERHSDVADLVVLPRWDSDLGFNARAWAAGTGKPVAGHDPAANPRSTRRERREVRTLALAVRSVDAAAHEIEHLRALVRALGLDDHVDSGFGRGVLSAEAPDAPLTLGPDDLVVHASSNEPKRHWPSESWSMLVDEVLDRGLARRVVVVGSAADRAEAERLVAGRGERAVAVAGEVPLAQLPGFLAGAGQFVGNDSGPAHLAAAMGVPVVVISPHPSDGDPTHRNSPSRFRPWGEHARVLQPAHALPPCSDACTATTPHCIRQVAVAEVLAALTVSSPTGNADASRPDFPGSQ